MFIKRKKLVLIHTTTNINIDDNESGIYFYEKNIHHDVINEYENIQQITQTYVIRKNWTKTTKLSFFVCEKKVVV